MGWVWEKGWKCGEKLKVRYLPTTGVIIIIIIQVCTHLAKSTFLAKHQKEMENIWNVI